MATLGKEGTPDYQGYVVRVSDARALEKNWYVYRVRGTPRECTWLTAKSSLYEAMLHLENHVI